MGNIKATITSSRKFVFTNPMKEALQMCQLFSMRKSRALIATAVEGLTKLHDALSIDNVVVEFARNRDWTSECSARDVDVNIGVESGWGRISGTHFELWGPNPGTIVGN